MKAWHRKGRFGVWEFIEGLYGLSILMVAFGINGNSSYKM